MIKYEKPQLINLSEEIMTSGPECTVPGATASGMGTGQSCHNGTTATGGAQTCKAGDHATGVSQACKSNGGEATVGCISTGTIVY